MKKLLFLIILSVALIFAAFAYKEECKVIPQNGETVYDSNSTISVSFSGELSQKLDVKNSRIFLNDKDISKKCRHGESYINYFPVMPLNEGKNEVKIEGLYKNGEKYTLGWTFYVQQQNDITSVEHDGKEILIARDVLNVTIKGKPAGLAYFDIGEKSKNIPMKEVSPGVYQGAYVIKEIDNFLKEDIIGHLKFSSQIETDSYAKDKVTIRGGLFLVKIISPKPDDRVGQSFEIVGKTKPHAHILISSLIWLKNIPIVNDLKADTGGYEATADENGVFKMKYGIPIKLKDTTFTLKFLAKDENGNYSIPHTLTLTQK